MLNDSIYTFQIKKLIKSQGTGQLQTILLSKQNKLSGK